MGDTTVYANSRAAIRRAVDRALRLPTRLVGPGTRSMAIGALLLTAASTASVVATTNTPPVFTSLTVSTPQAYEGQTVTLTGAFTDPDAGNRHTVIIYWYGGEGEELQQRKEKIQIPAGQRTFQVNYTYGDYVPIPPIPYPNIKVLLFDHEFPTNPNDNTTGMAHDTEFVPFQLLDAQAQFIPTSIKITRDHRSGTPSTQSARSARADTDTRVIVEGELSPREALESVQVTASWTGAASSETSCSMKEGTRSFACEHTYTSPSPQKGYPVTLRVQDDEGNQATHQVSVRVQ